MYVSEPAEIQHVICVSATGPTGFAYGGTNFDDPAEYTNYGQSLVSFAHQEEMIFYTLMVIGIMI